MHGYSEHTFQPNFSYCRSFWISIFCRNFYIFCSILESFCFAKIQQSGHFVSKLLFENWDCFVFSTSLDYRDATNKKSTFGYGLSAKKNLYFFGNKLHMNFLKKKNSIKFFICMFIVKNTKERELPPESPTLTTIQLKVPDVNVTYWVSTVI